MAVEAPAGTLIKREWIIQSIEEDLNSIDGTGNYHTDVASISRRYIPPSRLAQSDIPRLVLWGGPDRMLVEPEGGYNIQREMIVTVWGCVQPDDETNIDRDMNYLIEDVFRCLKADKQRDSLALWTRFGLIDVRPVQFTRPHGIFEIEVRVSYLYIDTDT